ncbi:MAG TPA: glucosidase [Actinomycetota bacterium]|nr:glucosidase [Actinomycetota bacterium]
MPWRRWGPYLAERAWGTVREDYSADGDAWAYFPHDHARSRVYRWNEDGMAGFCDDRQFLCLALALWNGADPILKERMFGLAGPEGNHAEDAKDYWFFLDGTPTHSWMRWRYLYPQALFPFGDLLAENRRRARSDAEHELLDTGAFDGGYWEVTADFAKADPEDVCLRIRATNVGDAPATLHIIPTLWLRNTWAWGRDRRRATLRAGQAHQSRQSHQGRGSHQGREPRQAHQGRSGTIVCEGHSWLGPRMCAAASPDAGEGRLLFCENETNAARLWGAAASPRYPKDGIHDHIVRGAATVNPDKVGTKAAAWFTATAAAGATVEVRVRLTPAPDGPDAGEAPPDLGPGFEEVMRVREAEANEWHAGLAARVGRLPDGAAPVLRQAAAGMLWSKQYFHYDVAHWLEGDPGCPPPPPGRGEIRNGSWRHLSNSDVISMPDTWEYPWYASWDLALQCIALAHLDPGFAKDQLVLLCREWFMHPNGQVPAYEWNFSDVNPPVLAYAALRVWDLDGRRDFDFLERMLHKLAINFTWWVNREDPTGTNVFAGGFLGLDNIAPFDRSKLPPGMTLEQADGTGWMAFSALTLMALALTLAANDPTYEDLATKFFEHFTYIAVALDAQGLWDEEDGFFYDLLRRPEGPPERVRVRSMVGLIPLLAVGVLEPETLEALPGFRARMEWFEWHRPAYRSAVGHSRIPGHQDRRLLSIVSPERLVRILGRLLDEEEFLSPHGIRALSRWHAEHPFRLRIDGMEAAVDYEPGESQSGLFGGNSNWRGPVWFPLNHLIIAALRHFDAFCGPGFTVEYPTGSGVQATLRQVANDLSRRLLGLFTESPDGRRPVHGGVSRFDEDPRWHDLIPFHEYFHGDTGAGLGASHQTGWTGLIIDLLLHKPAAGLP